MNERELFLSALEIEDAAAREEYLQSACNGDESRLARIQSLLASHHGESQFLQTPAPEQLRELADDVNTDTIFVGNGSTQEDEFGGASSRDDSDDDEEALGYLQPSTRPDSLGRLNHYEILEIIGRGAFGTVLRAFDDKLQRVVAIKVLAPELAATSPARKRFMREAQASAQVRHEHVVSIYDVHDRPIPYLVMEYIPGQTLQQRLDEQGPLDLEDVLRLGRQIAEGLSAAHARDLIHRDIKPGNILLEAGVQDRVKITDFGLARAADDASMTQSGMIAGTPLYMAPEQALGLKLDQRADLFSLGSVLYQMVSGRAPFRAPSALAVLKRVTEDTPRPIQEIIPETPDWLCDIIARLHAKNPDERFQTAREVADVLADCELQIKAHDCLKDHTLIPSKIPSKHPQRSASWGWIAAAAVLLPLIALITSAAICVGWMLSPPRSADGQQIAGWGTVVDPRRDTQLKLESTGLVVLVAGGEHNLNPTPAFNDVTAPRVLQPAEGGFELETRVDAFSPPQTGVGGIPKNYHGAGLLLWQDERNFVRFLRAANGATQKVFVHLEYFRDGRMLLSEGININNVPVALRIVRSGEAYRLAYSAAGSDWGEFRTSSPIHLSGKLQVGVAAANSTPLPFKATFSHLKFQPGTEATDQEWVQLFNGQDLTGWKTLPDHPGQWEVKDGILKGSKRQSHLFSERGDYRNFHLRAEVKVNLGGDSGILFRAPLELRRGRTPTEFGVPGCYEAELQLNRAFTRRTGSISHASSDAPPSVLGQVLDSSLTQPDEWFTYEVIAEGNHFITKINGKEVASCNDPLDRHQAGHIALQVWHANTLVQFRKLDIKELPPEEPRWVPLFNGQDLTEWKPNTNWKVVDGVLSSVALGSGSQLQSERDDFEDFHLRVEARINRGGNSGVFLRSPRGEFNPDFYEVEITGEDTPAVKTGGLWHLGTENIDAGPPPKPNDWFTMEVRAVGNQLTVSVNGRETARWSDPVGKYKKGAIDLQQLGNTVVQFRKIEIKELPAGPSTPPSTAIAPFDAEQAKAHQKAWAKHLGVPVEYTNSLGMKFRLIPPGEFTMGSTAAEIDAALQVADPDDTHWQECIRSEAPQHQVILTQPIYLSVHEVTQAEYEKVMGTNPSHFAPLGMGTEAVAGMKTTQHPIEMASWTDAADFCARLSEREALERGQGYRLPTEAAWEFACQAGTTTQYWRGDEEEDLIRTGWFAANSELRTHPVGSLEVNPFGLFDMHGNVWEWVEDAWTPDSYEEWTAKTAINPQGPPSTGGPRVIRGGHWRSGPANCRTAGRHARSPMDRDAGIGFRVSLPVDAVKVAIANRTPIAGMESLPRTFTSSIGMEFVIVPKGKFWMGGGSGKLGDQEVEIGHDFYLGKYEVTQEEWEQVTGLNPSGFSRTGGNDAVKDIADADLKRFPVEQVSWDDCQAFLKVVNEKTKEADWVYRLPTEAEWEYACRGGPSSNKFDYGFDFYFEKPSLQLLPDQANFNSILNRPCQVGAYQPNQLGLYDMHGNLFEWCDDEWKDDQGASRRVRRGGGWAYISANCRAAERRADPPSIRYGTFGLRVARVPSGNPLPEAKTPAAISK